MTARAYMPPVAGSVEWETPQELFDKLDAEFHFTLDVCATPDKAKCRRFFSPQENGLMQDWGSEVCWMNPPYGPAITAWIQKAYFESSRNGATVVCLLPARTDTRWWHNYAEKATERRFIKGRIKFGGHKNAAPFPSVLVIFRGASPCGERV